jgi:hypothetical protein
VNAGCWDDFELAMNTPMTPTLILDGIWGRPRRFDPLRRVLEAACGPTEIFHYNTSGCVPFEILARQLCERIRQFDEPVNLLGFSMGGIVIRTAHLLDPSLPVRRAVFLNTPHGGTVMSYLLPLGGTRQLQPTSVLMKQLAADAWNIPTLVTWCPFDTIIVPGRSANWPKAAQSIRSAPLFHNWPIWSGKIHRKIAGFLSQNVVASSREYSPGVDTLNTALRT